MSTTAATLPTLASREEVGALLAEEVRTAKEAELPFVMAHENDPNKGGCQFER